MKNEPTDAIEGWELNPHLAEASSDKVTCPEIRAINSIAAQIEQRVCEMVKADAETNEHPNATPVDYVRWAIEEVEANR